MSAALAGRQRADAHVRLRVERRGPTSVVTRVAESGSARIRFPRGGAAVPEGVLINTGGGVASGDRFRTQAALGPGAGLVLTSVAAEKVYRSDGPVARIETALTLEAGASLAWLPQETILYDRARLSRRLAVEMAADATAFLCEILVFGRAAHGESVREGLVEDRWRISRGGRLVYADSLGLSGDIAARLARPAVGGGARAFGSILYVAPDAEARLDEARERLEGAASEWGASAWNGLLHVRLLAGDGEALRRDAARFMTAFGRHPVPRVWNL